MSIANGERTKSSVDIPDLDRIFHSLGDPNRRRILALLREAETLKVGDIARAFSMTLNGVSKHLKVLERAGLVQRRIEGREHWIEVRRDGLEAAFVWIHEHYHFWSTRLDALSDIAHDLESNSEESTSDD